MEEVTVQQNILQSHSFLNTRCEYFFIISVLKFHICIKQNPKVWTVYGMRQNAYMNGFVFTILVSLNEVILYK